MLKLLRQELDSGVDAAMPQRIRRTGDQKIARRCRLGAAAPGANGAHPFCNISAAPFP